MLWQTRTRGRRQPPRALYRLGAALEKHAGVRVTRVPRLELDDEPAEEQSGEQPGAAGAGTGGGTGKGKGKRPNGGLRAGVRPAADPAADRLLIAPVFVLSGPRSGSTLLRVVLGSHPALHAPIETHVRRLSVTYLTPLARSAMDALGHNTQDLEHILWDRLLHRELVRSGKQTIVEKTPSNVFVAERLALCWPDARFLFLLRHPLSIARSWHEADPERRPMERAIEHTYKYMVALERTRGRLDGLTVRYEDLTADPEGETRRLCEFLGIGWDAGMITYGQNVDQGEFTKGLGDWRDKIRTGAIQPGRALPEPGEVPKRLREICRRWGYLPDESGTESGTGTGPG